VSDYANEYARYHAGPDVDDEHTCCGKCSTQDLSELPVTDMDGRAFEALCDACQGCEACEREACEEHERERAQR
jgi:MinD superfamily P-loop ATPase